MPRLKDISLYCPVCLHYVRNNQKGILCDICNVSHHANCVFVNLKTYNWLSSCIVLNV